MCLYVAGSSPVLEDSTSSPPIDDVDIELKEELDSDTCNQVREWKDGEQKKGEQEGGRGKKNKVPRRHSLHKLCLHNPCPQRWGPDSVF